MEDNIIMSTSVMQYLEEVRMFMRESHVVRSHEKFDILSSEQNDEENKGVEFDIEQAGNSELNPLDIDNQDQLSLFDNKLSLHDESDDKEEIFNTKSSAKKGKSEKEDTIKTTKTKSDASQSNANQEENTDFRKPTLTEANCY